MERSRHLPIRLSSRSGTPYLTKRLQAHGRAVLHVVPPFAADFGALHVWHHTPNNQTHRDNSDPCTVLSQGRGVCPPSVEPQVAVLDARFLKFSRGAPILTQRSMMITTLPGSAPAFSYSACFFTSTGNPPISPWQQFSPNQFPSGHWERRHASLCFNARKLRPVAQPS